MPVAQVEMILIIDFPGVVGNRGALFDAIPSRVIRLDRLFGPVGEGVFPLRSHVAALGKETGLESLVRQGREEAARKRLLSVIVVIVALYRQRIARRERPIGAETGLL